MSTDDRCEWTSLGNYWCIKHRSYNSALCLEALSLERQLRERLEDAIENEWRRLASPPFVSKPNYRKFRVFLNSLRTTGAYKRYQKTAGNSEWNVEVVD